MSARDDYPKVHANTSGPHHQGQTSTETQRALDEIDHLRHLAGILATNVDQTNAELEAARVRINELEYDLPLDAAEFDRRMHERLGIAEPHSNNSNEMLVTDEQARLIERGREAERQEDEVRAWVEKHGPVNIANIQAAAAEQARLIALGEALRLTPFKVVKPLSPADHGWNACLDFIFALRDEAERSRG